MLIHLILLKKRIPHWAEVLLVPGSVAEKLSTYWFKLISGTELLLRLRSGFLLDQIIDRFKDKTNSLLPEQLMQIYSAHDTTIASMLNGLGLFEVNLQYSIKILSIKSKLIVNF